MTEANVKTNVSAIFKKEPMMLHLMIWEGTYGPCRGRGSCRSTSLPWCSPQTKRPLKTQKLILSPRELELLQIENFRSWSDNAPSSGKQSRAFVPVRQCRFVCPEPWLASEQHRALYDNAALSDRNPGLLASRAEPCTTMPHCLTGTLNC